MKKARTELPSDVQKQMRALEALPDDQIDTTATPWPARGSGGRRTPPA